MNNLALNLGYVQGDFEEVPIEFNMGLGCGNPIAIGAFKEGETVLDLGNGGGFDCFLISFLKPQLKNDPAHNTTSL
jgi:arsenite methyltransferase